MKDLESLLGDLDAANRAGVFSKSAQPVMASSVTASEQAKFFLVSPRWAIAATLAIAIGVWSMMFQSKLSDVQDRSRMLQSVRANDLQSALASCVGGPSSTLNPLCGRVDFDGDGDADLRDFGTYQRDLGGSSH